MSAFKRVTVFHDGKILHETDGPAQFHMYPSGAYVRRQGNSKVYWDIIIDIAPQGTDGVSIQYERLPDWVKTWELLCR